MNRKSFFGRFAAPSSAKRTAERPDYFRASIEPLEDRKLLAATRVWVNDTWTNVTHPTGPLVAGDTVVNNLPGADLTSHNGVSGIYGTTAFGTVMISDGAATPTYTPTSIAGMKTITNAVDPFFVSINGTVSILEGTYTESDIVIDTPLKVIGNGVSGASQTLIVPEVASAHGGAADANFGVGTHSGIILYSYSATVLNLHLDGSGNSALNTSAGHTHNYHQGITTMYDLQGGGNYSAYNGGTPVSLPLVQLNIPGGPVGNRSIPGLSVDNATVDNTYWHGITLSALFNQSFGTTNGTTGPKINVSNSRVNNVGLTGGQDLNRIGILMQNLDNSPTPGQASFDIVNNAGVGIKFDAWGSNKVFGSSAGARNRGSLAKNTVNNAILRGLDLQYWDNTDNSAANTINNIAGSNSATGIYINHGEILMTANTVNGSLIGLHVQNTSRNVDPGGRTPFPTFAATFVLNGPGTGVAGSIGVLGENSSAEPNATSFGLSLEMFASGYETGAKFNQTVAPSNGEQTLIIVDRLNIQGNKTGFNLGNNVLMQGSWFSNDPVVVSGSATYDPGFTPFGDYAFGVPASNGHKVQKIQTSATAGPTGGTFTVTYNAQTTGAIAHNASAATVQTALNALGSVLADGGVTVTGGGGGTTNEWNVSFLGAGPTFGVLTINGGNLTGATNLTLTTLDFVQNTPAFPYNARVNPPRWDATPGVPESTDDPPNAGIIGTGGLVMASTGHYKAQLTQTAGTLSFQEFNNSINWLDLAQYNSIEANPWRSGYTPTGMSGTWVGSLTQDGTGSLIIDPNSANDLGLVYAGGTVPLDVTGYDTLQWVAKEMPGNTSDLILIVVADIDGTDMQYAMPLRLLNSTAYTTLTVNINAPAVDGGDGDNIFNLSKITAWGFLGDGGYTQGGIPGQVQIGLDIDRLEFTRPNGNDQLQVTSVNLGGSTLDGSIGFNFTPSVGQSFRIIDNTGGSAVTGTFAGLPQGVVTTLFNPFNSAALVNPNSTTAYKFQISYTGGNGNDVVLTRVADIAPVVDLNAGGVGTGNTSTWTGTAVPIAPIGTVTDADDTLLTGMTVTFSGAHDANDVLALTGSPLGGVTGVYSPGTGTLTLSGVASVSAYQTALQNVTYHNTTALTHADETLNVVAFDFETGSATAVGTVHIAYVNVLNSSVANRLAFYNNSFYDDASNDPDLTNDTAIATDKTAYLPNSTTSGYGNYTTYDKGINGLMIDFNAGGQHNLITASDFTFKMSAQGLLGQSNDPTDGSWNTPVPAPTSVTFRPAGTAVSPLLGYAGNVLPKDRIQIIWADGGIVDRWLEVIVKSNGNTGLPAQDVFFFGNMPGDTNDEGGSDFKNIDANDQFNTKTAAADPNNTGLFYTYTLPVAIANTWDHDRNGDVNASDQFIAKSFSLAPYTSLNMINLGPGGPFAPSGGGGSWVADRLASLESSGGSTASYFGDLADDDDSDDEDDSDAILDALLA